MLAIHLLKTLEGRQTINTVSELSGLHRQSALNLISRLKKQGFVTVSGGGKQKRIYKISQKFQRKKEYPGMFDILNKYSPEKIVPPFEHEPHTKYNVENAIIDLVEFDEIRMIVNSLKLFNHITNWALLYKLCKKKEVRKKIGALYDIARTVTRVKRIPDRTRKLLLLSPDKKGFGRSSGDFLEIEKKWMIKIPFNKKDLEVYKK